jgi:WD40-like Beta Propeller Repeat
VLRSRAGSFAVVCCLCAGAAAPSEGLAQQANAAAPQFCPAFLISGDLTLFPLNGPEVHVALPAEFPKDFRILASGPDGSSFYGERSAAFGIDKVELNPMHRSVVPGSSAMTEVRALTVEALTGRLLVTGACRSEHTNGIFEIDPAAGTLRVVRAPLEEPISPDGQHVVSRLGKQFSVLDLRGGSVQPIKGLASDARCFWSPNGQRIACVSDGHITLLDAHDLSRHKSLGPAGYGLVWSPDSTRLLLSRGCFLVPYGARLEVIDVDTGSRSKVVSSECKIATNNFGWLDRRAVQ